MPLDRELREGFTNPQPSQQEKGIGRFRDYYQRGLSQSPPALLLNDSEEECCGNEFEIDPTEDCISIDDGLYEESVDKFTVETVINYEENSEEGDI